VAARILAVATPRFALAGLSSGGYIVFAMLRQAPERIAKLALLNTSGRADKSEHTSGRETLIAKAETGKMSEVVETLMRKFLHRTCHRDEAINCVVRDMATDTGVKAFARQERAIVSRPDSRSLLASIACPILALGGDGDELTPLNLAQEIAGGIADARLVIVQDRGHLCTITWPEAVNAAVAEWLAGTE
jgi:pimeloyl-ACP methyl ester carboxylesterase